MRITLNIDDELLDQAKRMTGIEENASLVTEGLRALIERERARRLAELGGSAPDLRPVPRRRMRKSLKPGYTAARPPRFVVEPHSGGFRPGVDPGKLNQLVDQLESEDFVDEAGRSRK